MQRVMRRKKRYVLAACVCLLIKIYNLRSDFLNVPGKVVSRSFETDFHYPLDVEMESLVAKVLEGRQPSVEPINNHTHEFLTNSNLCLVLPQIDLLIAVNSATQHFERRDAIRKTYGKAEHVKGKVVRTLFFVGIHEDETSTMQRHLKREIEVYNDLIQANFPDYYYANTIKMVTTFRWLYENCPNAKYCLFTDDDMYISTANLVRYLESWELKVNGTGQHDRRLLAGKVLPEFKPQRNPNRRLYISFEDYPWDGGPPYAVARSFVMSSAAVRAIYAASLFVRNFIYGGVYIGIVAHKIGLRPTHCPHFQFHKKNYAQSRSIRHVIAFHGIERPKELIAVWNKVNNHA